MISVPMKVAVSEVALPIHVSMSDVSIPMRAAVGYTSGGVPYPGEYEVTPRFSEQVLQTNGFVMRDDVTVHEIPVTETTNPYGGKTILIG